MNTNIKHWIEENWILSAIIITALLIRIVFLSTAISMQGLDSLTTATTDSINYLKMAHWLLGTDIPYPEGRFFDWGIGHASWLAGILYLAKSNLAILLVQVVLSSLSCGMIYKLALELLNNKTTALIAALLLVFSSTSITLSILVLSETLFFFLMLWGLYSFIVGLRRNQWKYFIVAGCTIGYAVLVKSVGQFLFVPLLIITGLYLLNKFPNEGLKELFNKHKSVLAKAISAVCLIALIMSSALISNYKRYGIPTIAFTAAGGPANVAAWTTARLTGQDFREVKRDWYADYRLENNLTNLDLKDQYILLKANGLRVLHENPVEFIQTYFSNVWKNMNDFNYLPRFAFPTEIKRVKSIEDFIRKKGLQYLNILLSIIGLVILTLKRKYFAALSLLIIYSYYAVLLGASLWQGSRLFYPAQMVAVILMAVTMYSISRSLRSGYDKLLRNRSKQSA